MNFSEVWECVEPIKSWVQRQECEALWRLGVTATREARMLAKVPVAVDIGGARGRSSIVLHKAGLAVVTVSLWDDKDEGTQTEFAVNARRCGCAGGIVALKGNSNEVWKKVHHLDGLVDLLFVDGGHDKDTAIGDILGWGTKVRVGGYMAFHDAGKNSTFTGVNEAVAMLRTGAWGRQIGSWDLVGAVSFLTAFRRMA